MEFGKVKKIEENKFEISMITKDDRITISTDEGYICCENYGVKFLSGREFLKASVRNILVCPEDSEYGVNEKIEDNDTDDIYDRYRSSPAIKYITINTSSGNKCIIKCYNSHNGYYSHIFNVLRCDQIIHSFVL
jgi:hypothetical protein